ncbi:MAG: hypothetical protein ABI728_15165 [Betaproteobacteria bacterium]
MIRKSKTGALHKGGSVSCFVARVAPQVVDQANFILAAISFFSLHQAAHQRKEQP